MKKIFQLIVLMGVIFTTFHNSIATPHIPMSSIAEFCANVESELESLNDLISTYESRLANVRNAENCEKMYDILSVLTDTYYTMDETRHSSCDTDDTLEPIRTYPNTCYEFE